MRVSNDYASVRRERKIKMLRNIRPAGQLEILRKKPNTGDVVFNGFVSYAAMQNGALALARQAGQAIKYGMEAKNYDKARSFWYSNARRCLRSAICLCITKADVAAMAKTLDYARRHGA